MPKNPTYPECFDEVRQITIAWLRQRGLLRKGRYRASGSLHWARGGNPLGNVLAVVDTTADAYLQLDYLANGKSINYRVPLESRISNLGKGKVWYFICPATGKRCRTLYGIGEYFLSRFAYPSAMYGSQTESKLMRALMKLRYLDLESNYLSKRHARTTYKGKLTKRYRRILDKQGRFDPNALRRILGSVKLEQVLKTQ